MYHTSKQVTTEVITIVSPLPAAEVAEAFETWMSSEQKYHEILKEVYFGMKDATMEEKKKMFEEKTKPSGLYQAATFRISKALQAVDKNVAPFIPFCHRYYIGNMMVAGEVVQVN